MKTENINLSFSTPNEFKFTANNALNNELYKSEAEVNSTSAVKVSDVNANKSVLEAVADRLVGANTSLIIEKNPNSAGFIYKSVNSTTGEVIRIWPQQEIASELSRLKDFDARGIVVNKQA